MRLSKLAREILTVMASRPPERPWVLYQMRSGPSLMRSDQSWLDVQQRQVDRMAAAGLLFPVASDGVPERVAYWTITEAGRAAITPKADQS